MPQELHDPGTGQIEPVLLLLSGGADSTTLLADLRRGGQTLVALTFAYGQRHASEVVAARRFAARYGAAEHVVVRIDLQLNGVSTLLAGSSTVATYDGTLPSGPVDTYVPMRNLIFVAHAAALAESKKIRRILIAFNADDMTNYWDCAAEFVQRVNATLRLAGPHAPQVEAPYLHMSKAQVLSRARALGVDLAATVTCYAPRDGEACGRCLACRVRGEAEPG